MSQDVLLLRRLIRRLHQANTTAEERRHLVEIGTQAALLTAEEAVALAQDPTQLNADQHYRIWDWVHRWEREHRHDDLEWDPYPEHHND
ncbi:MAG: hypothetical protein Q6L60_03200 [Thermostichus sp. HHBFW_bins_43]